MQAADDARAAAAISSRSASDSNSRDPRPRSPRGGRIRRRCGRGSPTCRPRAARARLAACPGRRARGCRAPAPAGGDAARSDARRAPERFEAVSSGSARDRPAKSRKPAYSSRWRRSLKSIITRPAQSALRPKAPDGAAPPALSSDPTAALRGAQSAHLPARRAKKASMSASRRDSLPASASEAATCGRDI